ncbi:uncharacterized protein LOC122310249 [Carya illinoinensis]|uniref:uncharacterized protein LOC122310249 n=1 Tax=Carya illinoinensis TaxID=32201 RepID=UPI001C7259EF|nr:uncharacterized protein LOC122310249 [Carya illinoinensis]
MISDNQSEIKYHSGKANVVANAFSCKTQADLPYLLAGMWELLIGKLLRDAMLFVVQEIVPLTKEENIKEQGKDDKLERLQQRILRSEGLEHFSISKDGMLCYKERKVIPSVSKLKEEILKEAHCTRYATHLGSTKIYRDLKGQF